jgi:AraC-like DNA-binding protein
MIPGQVHSWHFKGDMDGYVVHFEGSLFTTFLQNTHYLEQYTFFNGNCKDGVIQLPATVHEKVIQLFESMLAESGESKEQSMDMIRFYLLELFVSIDRAGDISKRVSIAPQKLTLLRNYQQLIDKHFRDIKLPKEFADLLYITPNHLNALCQDLLGKTAGDLIHDRVILEAKRLLTNADMTVTQIAYNLNFQDNSYFNRFFKKEVGVTPDEFRRQFINKSN